MKLISGSLLVPIDSSFVGDQLDGYKEFDKGHVQLKLYTDDDASVSPDHSITFCDSLGYVSINRKLGQRKSEFIYWDLYDKPNAEIVSRTILLATVETSDSLALSEPGSVSRDYFIESGKWEIRSRNDGKLGYNLVLVKKLETNMGPLAENGVEADKKLDQLRNTAPNVVKDDDFETSLSNDKWANITVQQDNLLVTYYTMVKANRNVPKALVHYPKYQDDNCGGEMLGFLAPGRKIALMHNGEKLVDMNRAMWEVSICPRPYPEFVLEEF